MIHIVLSCMLIPELVPEIMSFVKGITHPKFMLNIEFSLYWHNEKHFRD